MAIDTHMAIMLQAFGVALLVFLTARLYGDTLARFLKDCWAGKESEVQARPQVEKIASKLAVPRTDQENGQSRELRLYKDLYYKLQNLERFPEVLPQSRDLLLAFFAESLAGARSQLEPGILSVEKYTPESLEEYLQSDNDKTTQEWEQYMSRRRAGGPSEMFGDQEEAKWWLKQMAPVKYVDGAWLGHIHKITTPFAVRGVTKDAWQVLSEELGDGDPEKNHVYVYRELMRKIGAGLPDADALDFLHPRHQLNEKSVWKAAVAQLLISLFPHEFLPEILGFNMHFEALTLETIMAAREVEEMGLNPYYFVLHISIDNADSGHTAIAMQAVVKYLEQVRQAQGAFAAHQAWKRVQTGYILSKGVGAGPRCPSMRTEDSIPFPRNAREAELIRIFKAKAPVAHKIHCSSRMKIGGRSLEDWLEPTALAGKQWQMEFLDHLSKFRPWVRRGDSGKSKLIQELSWEGKMFGSFTQREVEIVRLWIDGLEDTSPQAYWSFVGRPELEFDQINKKQDICVDYPVLSSISMVNIPAEPTPFFLTAHLPIHSAVEALVTPEISKLLPLWFASPCLLESFVCIPSKTTTTTASAIVRLLRAEYGFDIEGPGVAGMDEARRVDSTGLIELGMEIIKRLGLAEPTNLKEVLEIWPSEFAFQMLQLSMRPMANYGLLLGLAWAFVGLRDVLSSSALLSVSSRAVLTEMVRRERDCLKVCFKELKDDKIRCADFHRGYSLGWAQIASCFAN